MDLLSDYEVAKSNVEPIYLMDEQVTAAVRTRRSALPLV
jgi:hypothetical protein